MTSIFVVFTRVIVIEVSILTLIEALIQGQLSVEAKGQHPGSRGLVKPL